MVWSPSALGNFTLSSAYQEVRHSLNPSLVCGKLWHAKIPLKISFFMLRLVSNSLPLADSLARFGVHGPSWCFCCVNPQHESFNHIFSTARKVWQFFEFEAGIFDPGVSIRCHLVKWWLSSVRNVQTAFVFRVLPVFVCWFLWKARNAYFFEGKQIPWSVICDQILSSVLDSFSLQFKGLSCDFSSWPHFLRSLSTLPRHSKVMQVQWFPSAHSLVKLNSDGCSKGNPGIGGGGGLLRDSQGYFLFGFSCYFGWVSSLQAEIKALLFGVKLCLSKGYTLLHIECDSLLLVEMIKGKSGGPWTVQRDLQELLQYKIHFAQINHCFREANCPADRLSNVGVLQKSDVVYESFAALPRMVRGDVKMDRLGFPSFRRI